MTPRERRVPSSSGHCCAGSGIGTWTCEGPPGFEGEDEVNMQRRTRDGRETELNSLWST